MTTTQILREASILDGWKWLGSTSAHSCNCLGPQNGQPLCPCHMRNVQVKDGRYVEIIDHGPVRAVSSADFSSFSKAIAAAEASEAGR